MTRLGSRALTGAFMVVTAVLVAGCGGAKNAPATVTVTAPPPTTAETTTAETTTPDMTTATAPSATETTQSAPDASTAAKAQAIMPNVVCMNLQVAQDVIQGAGVFFSRSRDATGKGRHQILDRDWTVVAQTPSPGTPFGEGDAVLSVVKNGEPNPC